MFAPLPRSFLLWVLSILCGLLLPFLRIHIILVFQAPFFLFCIVFLPVEVVYELTDTGKAKSPQAALCQHMRKQPLICCSDLLTSRRSIPYDPHDQALQQTTDLHASILLHTIQIL